MRVLAGWRPDISGQKCLQTSKIEPRRQDRPAHNPKRARQEPHIQKMQKRLRALLVRVLARRVPGLAGAAGLAGAFSRFGHAGRSGSAGA